MYQVGNIYFIAAVAVIGKCNTSTITSSRPRRAHSVLAPLAQKLC
jgi:hypothetical protein